MQTRLSMVALIILAASSAGAQGPAVTAAPAPTITLTQVLEEARQASGRIGAARARAEGETSARMRMPGFDNPVLDIRTENWTAGGSPLARDTFVIVTQPFPLGGKRGARFRLADAEVAVAQADVGFVQQQLLLDVADRYVGALYAGRLVHHAREHTAAVDELVGVLQRRVREGIAAEGDLARVQAELARLAIQRARAEADETRQRLTLSALIGRADTGGRLEPLEPDLAGMLARLDTDAARLNEAIDRHPAVAVAKAAADRAARQAELDRSLGQPDLLVTGGYKRTAGLSTGVGGVALALPVFNANQTARARAEGAARAAALELATTRLRIEAEVTSAIESARTLARAAGVLDQTLLAPAAVARSAARARFREGESDVLGLVDAERVWNEARREEAALRADALSAAVRALLILDHTP